MHTSGVARRPVTSTFFLNINIVLPLVVVALTRRRSHGVLERVVLLEHVVSLPTSGVY